MANIIDRIRKWMGHQLNGLKHVGKTGKTWSKLTAVEEIAIISDVTEQEAKQAAIQLKNAVKTLCAKAKVTMIMYYDKKRGTNGMISADDTIYFNGDAFSFWYKIEDNELKKAIDKDYCITITLTNGEHDKVDFVRKYVKAFLRIGGKGADNGELNFVIDTEKATPQQTNKEIIKYLEMMFGEKSADKSTMRTEKIA